MEASGLNAKESINEETALKGLLDAFGSAFSLDEIASAYCKAGRNADLAGEFLFQLKRSTSMTTISSVNGDARESEQSSESSCVNVSEQPCEENGSLRPSNPKHRPVSIGTVSSIIGKDYARTTRSTKGSCYATKPLKMDSKVLPESELWGEEAKSNSKRDDSVHRDMEEFLFRMLGEGFKLERDVIRDVLDACGYDMPKGMEKLLDMSTITFDEKNRNVGDSTKFAGLHSEAEVPSYQGKHTNYSLAKEDTSSNLRANLCTEQKQRNDLERELLSALFVAPEKKNDYVLLKEKVKTVKRSGVFGKTVDEPLYDSSAVHKTTAVYPQEDDEYDRNDDSYLAIRKNVKVFHEAMKDYYKAAVDAYVKRDRVRAVKLLEQGYFFYEKAREADEESNQMILETRNVEVQDGMLLDLHEHGAKEAIRLLKCHLSSLSGIPSIEYLKVIIETNEEDSSKGARRRLVLKLLEKESIKWEEKENAGTILIRLDSINRKLLSFVKN